LQQQKPPFIWLNIVIFVTSLVLALVVTPWYGIKEGFGFEHLIWLLVTFSFTNLSITAGYHRLWSHKTYEAHPLLRIVFAIGGAFSLQNSALHWSSDHRMHHKFVDHCETTINQPTTITLTVATSKKIPSLCGSTNTMCHWQ